MNDINALTLDEKILLLTGKNFWETQDFNGKLDKIVVSDGPCGLRKNEFDENGQMYTVKSTAYPCVHVVANTWNKELSGKVAQCMADDCIDHGVDILLAPGVNIKRHPFNGRNFEYFSEDPFLSGTMAKEYIKGVQSKGVGTSLKHFCANNLERDRLRVSSEVDDRALNEIYLKPFEIALQAQPTTVMCSYNKINGVWASEHKKLLTDILRNKLGFKGVVVSDWDAVHDRVKSLQAGVDLEMPFRDKSFGEVKLALERGEITLEKIDESVQRLLDLIKTVVKMRADRKPTSKVSYRKTVAEEVAEEGMVLIKNDGLLPLADNKKIAVLSLLTERAFTTGEGSARVQSDVKMDSLSQELKRVMPNSEITEVEAYTTWRGVIEHKWLSDSLPLAYESDVVIIPAGIDYRIEGEGFDRQSLKLQPRLEKLIKEVASVNPNVVVVLSAGSAVDVSEWIDCVKSVILSGFAGEKTYEAVSKIIAGKVCPSGKLAETFAFKAEDYPSFPGETDSFINWYKESIFVGYRYFDRYKIPVRYPFGYGLSYAKFEYSDLAVKVGKDFNVEITYSVKNVSKVDGKEISQVYVKDVFRYALKCEKELKGYSKDLIKAGKTKKVSVKLDRSAFSYYSTALDKWVAEQGEFEIYVGTNSCDLPLKAKIKL